MVEIPLTGGVQLQLLEERHVDELYALVEVERDRLARWLPWAGAATREDIGLFVERTRRQQEAHQGTQSAITVNGRVAGTVGVHGISWQDESTSIGYWLSARHEGRGIVTAAVRAYTEHAFSVWGLNRVELRAAVENARSRAIAERLGFTHEGLLRQAEKVGERRLDLVVYSMLAGEWRG